MPSPAQATVLLAWTVAGALLVGWGSLVRRCWKAPARGPEDLLVSFWLGWAALVLALQCWHIALPIDVTARLAVAAVGVAGLALVGGAPWREAWRRPVRALVVLAAATLVAVWLANHALAGPRYGDVNAYFVPTVRWLEAYPVVPGLANLHAHYALNQSYFGYLAALEAGPFAARGFHLANGLLVLVLGLRVLTALAKVLRLGRRTGPIDVYWTILAPGVWAFGVSIWLTSPNPDVAIFALGAVSGAELLALATDEPGRGGFHLRALALLAVAGLTVKLSFAGFALAIVAVALWLRAMRTRPASLIRECTVVASLGLVALGPWVARNVVMSGLPLFPSAVITVPVEWRVGTDVEGWLRNTVYVGGWRAILASPRWFAGILRNWGWFEPAVTGPIAVGAAGIVVATVRRIAMRLRRRGTPHDAAWLPLALVLPGLASLLFCIVLSPVPRYAGATIWIVAATGFLVAASDRAGRPWSALRVLVLIVVGGTTVTLLRTGFDPFWLPLRDFELVGPIPWEARVLETGATVNVPIGIEACGSVPLPCTAYPNPALRLRRPGDLRSGFMLDPALAERYHYDPARGPTG